MFTPQTHKPMANHLLELRSINQKQGEMSKVLLLKKINFFESLFAFLYNLTHEI